MKSFTARDYGYAVISRFEEAFRSYLASRSKQFYEDPLDSIPRGVIDKSKKRMSINSDEVPDILEYSDFPDLKDIVFFNNSFSDYFPDTNFDPSEFSTIIDTLYSHRCRIDHVRSVYTKEDVKNLVSISSSVAIDLDIFGSEFVDFTKTIYDDPNILGEIIPACYDMPYSDYGIFNNIPTPDYTVDGGFVGRTEDIQKILKIITSGIHRVITISGAGGVGKTAIAHKITDRLATDKKNAIDGVIWVSAKEDKLTHIGIEPLEPSIKNYDDLLDTIANVMQFGVEDDADIPKKEEHIRTVLDIYSRVLLVVDNLETINDPRIIDFILDAHPNLLILITSRRGLGQVERRYELKQLKPKEAIKLFRVIAYEKGLSSLGSLSPKDIEKIVIKLACYPLAIKWVLGNVACGKHIDDIVSNIHKDESDISRFCFEQIFKGLSNDTKNLLFAITFFDKPVSSGTLKYMCDSSKDNFEDSIQELLILSLITQEQAKAQNEALVNNYSILSLTRGFLLNQLDSDIKARTLLSDRFQSVQSLSNEASKVNKHYASGLSDYGASTNEEHIAAMYAQSAYQKASVGLYEEARALFKKATEIAPHLHTIYRSWAVIESNENHHVDADNLFRKSLELAKDDFLTLLAWGNMKKKNGQFVEAVTRYEKALVIKPNSIKALAPYGHTLSMMGQYSKATVTFEALFSAIEENGVATESMTIHYTACADNHRRWAEQQYKSNKLDHAKKLVLDAYETILRATHLSPMDRKAQDFKRKICLEAAKIYKTLKENDNALKYATKALVKQPERFKETEDTIQSIIIIANIGFQMKSGNSCKEFFTPYYQDMARRVGGWRKREYEGIAFLIDKSSEYKKGTIVKANELKKFFVISPDDPLLQTHISFISDVEIQPKDFNERLIGKKVNFIPTVSSHRGGKSYRGKYVSFIN